MMEWTGLVKAVAPWIGTALGGPAGPLVGMAVGALADAMGLKEKTVDAVQAALSGATPEMMAAIKKADQEFQVKMQELGFKTIVDLEAIAAGDRKSAREMQVAVRSWVPGVLAIFVTFGFFTILIGLLRNELKTDNPALLIMLGSLGTAWTGIIAYYFGSSAGSARKDELAAGALPEPAQIKPSKIT